MNEITAVWHPLRNHVGPYGRLTRIESPTESGIPDVAYTIRGVSGWVENKIFDRGERSAPRHLTLAQVLWGESEEAAGGKWFTFGRFGRIWLLYDARGARALIEGDERSTPIFKISGRFPTRELLEALAPLAERKP